MNPISLAEFKWPRCRDKYELDRNGIEARSDKFDWYKPAAVPDLFLRFADEMKPTGEGLRQFADLYGLPGGGRTDLARPGEIPIAAAVDRLLVAHDQMRRAVQQFENGNTTLLRRWFNDYEGTLRVQLVGDGNGLHMAHTPPDLLRFMWWSFAEAVCTGAQIVRCINCMRASTVGTGQGRRRTRKYCSERCKQAVKRRRGSEAHYA